MAKSSNNPYEPSSLPAESPKANIDLSGFVRVNQIIVVALATGLSTFTAFVVYQFINGPDPLNWKPGTLAITGWAFAGSAIPLSFIFPKLFSQAQMKLSSDDDVATLRSKLLQSYQTQVIIGCALLEGSGFLNSFAFMQEHHPASIVTSVVLIALIALRIPTEQRVRYWLAEQG